MGEHLIGRWENSDYPGHLTIATFFEDGRGLLLHSHSYTCFIDQFEWSPVRDGVIRVKWIVRYDYDGELVEDEPDTEEVKYQLADSVIRNGFLRIALGYDAYDTEALHYSDKPGSYEEELAYLHDWAENATGSDFFGMFQASDSSGSPEIWERAREEEREERRVKRRAAVGASLQQSKLKLLCLISVCGPVLLLSDLKAVLPVYVAVGLMCVPVLALVLDEDDAENPFWRRVIRKIRRFASGWYLLLTLASCASFICGSRPGAWQLGIVLLVLGAGVHVQILVKLILTDDPV